MAVKATSLAGSAMVLTDAVDSRAVGIGAAHINVALRMVSVSAPLFPLVDQVYESLGVASQESVMNKV